MSDPQSMSLAAWLQPWTGREPADAPPAPSPEPDPRQLELALQERSQERRSPRRGEEVRRG